MKRFNIYYKGASGEVFPLEKACPERSEGGGAVAQCARRGISLNGWNKFCLFIPNFQFPISNFFIFFISILSLISCNAPLNPSWSGKFLLTKGMAYNNYIWIYSKPEQEKEFAFNPRSGFLKTNSQPITFLYKQDEVLIHLPDSLPSSGNSRNQVEYLNQKILFDFQCYYAQTKKGKEIRLIGKAVEKKTTDAISQFDFTVVFLKPD